MAYPKKGLRKITVDGHRYGYNVTGDDYQTISFSIVLLEKDGQILTGRFSFNSGISHHFDKNGKVKFSTLFQRIKITPDTIKQVIKYGLNCGWNPFENKGQMRLGYMDDKINLTLKEDTKFPDLKQNQVALNFAKSDNGRSLKIDKELYMGEGEIYQVFDTLQIAKEYAREIVKEDSGIDCWIMKEKAKPMFYISAIEEIEFN